MDDIDILQELFDSEPVVAALGSPLGLRNAALAIKQLRVVASGDDAAAVAQAWTRLCGALGGRLTAALLSGPEWATLCPPSRPRDDYDADDRSQVVWLSDSQKVVATAVMDGDQFIGVRFDCAHR